MKKKLFITAIVLAVFTFALIPYSFANNGMDGAVNGIRNFVGGAENVVEDAGKGAINGIRDGVNAIGNGAEDVANGIDNGMNRDDNMRTTGMTDGNNGGYTATRTSADTGNAGLFGNVSNNVWTWMVLAIVGIIIVALVMYYAKQNNITTYTNDDGDE